MKYDLIIAGTIGYSVTADYVRYFLSKRQGQPTSIGVCSLGGYVSDGLGIYEAIKNHGQCTVHFIGMSASAATFMAMGAKRITMAKNALLLIHNASVGAGLNGSFNKEQLDTVCRQLNFQREQLQTIDDVIAQIYADRSGKPADEMAKAMGSARWLKPQDALSLGIIDEIEGAVDVPAQEKPTNALLDEMQLPALDAEPSLFQKAVAALRAVFTIDGLADTTPTTEPTAELNQNDNEMEQEQNAPQSAAMQEQAAEAPQVTAAAFEAEVQRLRASIDEAQARFDALQAENTSLRQQVEALKKAPAPQPEPVDEPVDQDTIARNLTALLADL